MILMLVEIVRSKSFAIHKLFPTVCPKLELAKILPKFWSKNGRNSKFFSSITKILLRTMQHNAINIS